MNKPDELTILVIKENAIPRAFHISMKWLIRAMVAFSILMLFSFGSFFVGLKYFGLFQRSHKRVAELESQLGTGEVSHEVGFSLISYIDKLLFDTQSRTGSKSNTQTEGFSAIETESKDAITTQVPRAEARNNTPALKPPVLRLFTSKENLSDTHEAENLSKEISLSVLPPKIYWDKNQAKLTVQYSLQYISKDQGNQQGKILTFARGKSVLLVYPPGALNKAGSPTLIHGESGEFFSVSRFRMVNAEFTGVHYKEMIDEIEILLLDLDSNVIYYQVHKANLDAAGLVESSRVIHAPVKGTAQVPVQVPVPVSIQDPKRPSSEVDPKSPKVETPDP